MSGMDAEKYVSEIVRKIKCTKAKRQEIKSQLLSDIAMRTEAGEPLAQIMESMGTVKEIAEAFGQDLPEAERKAYQRRKILFILIAAAAVLLLLCLYVRWILPKAVDISGDERFSREEVTAEVEKVIDLLNREDYAALQKTADEEMQSVLNQEVIGSVKSSICADWGELQAVGTVYMGGVSRKGCLMVVTQVDVIYENISVVYTISFDENMRLAGLYMR